MKVGLHRELKTERVLGVGYDCASTMSGWPSGPTEVGVCFTETPSSFFCQLISQSENLDQLMGELAENAPNFSPLNAPSAGVVCCAQFTEDDGWYRAKVLQVEGAEATVVYIDYGNSEKLSTSRLRAIPENYGRAPGYALHCSLSGIVPASQDGEWSADAVARVTELLPGDRVLTMKVVLASSGGRPAQIRLVDTPANENVAALLVSEGFAQHGDSTSVRRSNGPVAGMLPTTEEMSIAITFSRSPSEFWYQEFGTTAPLDELMSQIADRYNGGAAAAKLSFVAPQVGDWCCVCSCDDQLWYRAVVLCANPLTVRFLDYGNIEYPSSVKHLTEDALRLAPQASQGCMLGVASSNGRFWSEAACTTFFDLCNYGEEVLSAVRHNGAYFELKLPSGQSVSELLVQKGLAKVNLAHANSSSLVPKLPPAVAQSSLAIGNEWLDVVISHVDSVKSFCVQLCQNYAVFKKLTAEISAAAASSGPIQQALQEGHLCLALYQDVWYRGQVTRVDTSDRYQILFVDFGNTEVVAAASLRPIEQWMCVLRQQSVRCSLVGAATVSNHPAAAAVLNSYMDKGAVLVAQVTQRDLTGRYFVNLVDTVSQPTNDVGVLQTIRSGFTMIGAPAASRANVAAPIAPTPAATSSAATSSAATSSAVAASRAAPAVSSAMQSYTHPRVVHGVAHPCLVTHCESPSEIYITLDSMQQSLDALMAELEQAGPSLTPLPRRVKRMPCCAVFSEDGAFYRAQLTSDDGDGTVDVQFVDYGNSEARTGDLVLTLPPASLNTPLCSVRCSLADIELQQTWPQAVCEQVSTMLTNVAVEMTAVGGEGSAASPFSVRLRLEGQSVAELLCRKNLARPKQSTTSAPASQPASSQPRQSTASTTVASAPATRMAPSAQLPQAAIQVDSNCKGFVVHAETPSTFSVQLNELSGQLDAMSHELQRSRPDRGQTWQVGDLCVAPFSGDGSMYRARVVEMGAAESCKIYYLDYGNTDRCPASSLSPMAPALCKVPALAIKCSLFNVLPPTGTWEGAIFKVMSGIAEAGDEMTINFKQCNGDRWAVRLLDAKGRDLADHLINSKLARRGEQGQASADRRTPVNTSIGMPAAAAVELRSLNLTVGFTDYVTVSYFVSPSEFCCLLQSTEGELETVMAQLGELCTSSSPPSLLTNAEPGVVCAAQFTEDDTWYRAVIGATSSDTYAVVYADYGNSETLPRERVRMLPVSLAALPAQALRCCLQDAVPTSTTWDPSVCAKFEEIVNAGQFKIEVTALPQGGGGVCTVKMYDESGASLSDAFTPATAVLAPTPSIQHTERAVAPTPSIQHTERTASPACGVMTGKLSFFPAPQYFFVQLDNDAEDLATILDTLASAETAYLTVARVGVVCAACASDGVWYRGRISGVDADAITVDFIDFGFTEEVELGSLSDMPEGLCATRDPVATYCRLYGATDDLSLSDDAYATAESFLNKDVELVIKNVGDNSVLEVDVLLAGRSLAQALGIDVSAASQSAAASSVPTSSSARLVVPSAQLPDGPFDVSVWECASPMSVWCQLADDSTSAALEELQAELAEHCASAGVYSNASVGSSCAALFDDDGVWYRATVLQVVDDASVKVVFSDYGNSQVVSVDNLRVLSPQLAKQPSVALRCVLSGYEMHTTDSVDSSLCARLSTLVVEQLLTAVCAGSCVVDGVTLPVCTLTDADGSSISEELAASVAMPSVPLTASAATAGTVTPTLPAVTIATSVPTLPPPQQMSVDSQVTMFVSYFQSSNNVWCQPASSADQLAQLQEDLAAVYGVEGSAVTRPENLLVGMFVAALYEGDGGFYRGRVQRVTPRTADVFFSDYGNTQTVSKVDIYNLEEPQFTTLPCQAVLCRLNTVAAEDAAVEEFIDQKECTITVKAVLGIESVRADMDVDGVNIAQQFSSAKQATDQVPAASPQEQAPQPAVAAAAAAAGDEVRLTDYCQLLKPGDTHVVRLVDALSPDEIYVQHADPAMEGAVADLLMEMNEFYATDGTTPTSEEVDDAAFFAAQFSTDDGWYRAVVLEKDGAHAHVSFVDYGNKEWCSYERLRHLEPQFASLAQQSFCIALPVDCSGECWAEGAATLIMSLEEDTLEATVLSADDGYVVSELTADSVDLAQMLVNGGFAVRQNAAATAVVAAPESTSSTYVTASSPTDERRAGAPTSPQLSMYQFEDPEQRNVRVLVTHVVSPYDFYCQPMNLVDEFNQQQEAIGDYVTTCPPTAVTAVTAGVFCLAKFEDERWYRSRIESVLPSSAVTVLFVDFGNQADVAVTDLLPLPERFAALPWCTVKCSVYTIAPATGKESWSDEATADFTNAVQDQELVLNLAGTADPKGIEQPVHFVDARDTNNANISAVLVSTGSADRTCSDTESSPGSEQPVVASAFPTACRPLVGSATQLTVCALISPFEIWCQLADATDGLEELGQELANLYATADCPVPTLAEGDVLVGKWCVAQFSMDACWYRARILSTDVAAQTAFVRFVDYGNTDTVEFACIRAMVVSVSALPQQAFCLSLQGIRPVDADDDWTPEVQEFLLSLEGSVCDVVLSSVQDQSLEGSVCDVVLSSVQDQSQSQDKEVACSLNNDDVLFNASMRNADGDDVATLLCQSGLAVRIKPIDAVASLVASTPVQDEISVESTVSPAVSPLHTSPSLSTSPADLNSSSRSSSSVQTSGRMSPVEELPSQSEALSSLRPSSPASTSSRASSPSSASASASNAATSDPAPLSDEPALSEESSSTPASDAQTMPSAPISVSKLRRDAHEVRSQSSWSVAASTASEPGMAGAGDLLALDQTVAVEITHIETPSDFWCQVVANGDSLERTMSLLNSQQPPVLAELVVGASCCAVYTEDVRLYRGSVESIGQDTACVRFTDYGNAQECAVAEILELPHSCLTLPMQAIHCELAYGSAVTNTPAEWSDAAIEMFQELVANGVDATLVAGLSQLSVDLQVEGSSVLDTLVAEDLAVRRDTASLSDAATGSCPASIDLPDSLPVPLVEDSTAQSALSPNAAAFTPTTTGRLPSGGRLLTPDSAGGGVAAVAAAVGDSSLSSASVSPGRSASPLTTPSSEHHATDYSAEGLALPPSPSPTPSPTQELDATESATATATLPALNPGSLQLTLGMDIEVAVSLVSSLCQVWVHEISYADQLASLGQQLADLCADSNPCDSGHTVGSLYAVYFEKDDAWYRARVLSVDHNACEMLFIDYGNVEPTSFEFICSLPEEIANCPLPPQAICCSLSGYSDRVLDDISLQDVYEKLMELGTLTLSVVSEASATQSASVKLLLVSDNVDVDAVQLCLGNDE